MYSVFVSLLFCQWLILSSLPTIISGLSRLHASHLLFMKMFHNSCCTEIVKMLDYDDNVHVKSIDHSVDHSSTGSALMCEYCSVQYPMMLLASSKQEL